MRGIFPELIEAVFIFRFNPAYAGNIKQPTFIRKNK